MPSSKTLVALLFGLLLGVMLASAANFTAAQPTPQVPSIQSPNKTAGRGQGIVLISGQFPESSPEFGSPLFQPFDCPDQSTRLNQSPES